ncbi:MAG TPA: alpha/beta hydrolase [Bryobacteraceae bacterium]|nr:alpha/beta hydrolase [Bryobacteraceae bacterium]
MFLVVQKQAAGLLHPSTPLFDTSSNSSLDLREIRSWREFARQSLWSGQRRGLIAWSQPGALTATIHYYRTVWKKRLLSGAEYRIRGPTLVIRGKNDAYAMPELAEATRKICEDGRVVYLDQSSHWVQHDEPGKVLTLLSAFLGA